MQMLGGAVAYTRQPTPKVVNSQLDFTNSVCIVLRFTSGFTILLSTQVDYGFYLRPSRMHRSQSQRATSTNRPVNVLKKGSDGKGILVQFFWVL